MKLSIILICFLSFSFSTRSDLNIKMPAQEKANFDWLVGNWIRTNGKKESTTTEVWEKSSGNLYLGTGLTKKNNEIVFRENLRLLKKGSNWIYEVTGVNADTTNFVIQSFSNNSFIAINPDNPFPKKIEYVYKDEKLVAVISDDDKKIEFEFKRE